MERVGRLARRYGQWLRRNFGDAYSEAFVTDTVVLMHKRDRLPLNEWLLVYNNIMTWRYGFFLRLFVSTACFIFPFAGIDYYRNGRFTYPAFERLRRDFKDLGVYSKVVSVFMVISFVSCLRIGLLNAFRIYQSRASPDQFCVVRPLLWLFKQKVLFNRSEVFVRPAFYMADKWEQEKSGRSFALFYLHVMRGPVVIRRQGTLLDQDFFRANNLRTYMLNETQVVPPQLKAAPELTK